MRRVSPKLQLLIFVVVVCGMLAISSITPFQSYKRNQTIAQLSQLTESDIATIQIGRQCFFPKTLYPEVLSALRTLEPFQPNHDFGGYIGFLRITSNTGAIYRIELDKHARGTIFHFFYADDGNAFETQPYIDYTSYGEGISPTFPQVLALVSRSDTCQVNMSRQGEAHTMRA